MKVSNKTTIYYKNNNKCSLNYKTIINLINYFSNLSKTVTIMSRRNSHTSILSTTLKNTTACIFFVASVCSPVLAAGSSTPNMAMQQQKTVTIKGAVVDTNGEPLLGVSILEKGTTNGVATNMNGEFTLNVKGSASVLVVSYVGYQTKQITVGNQRQLKIVLEDDTEVLQDAVVIGYGTQRKGDVTSAIASVKAEDFTVGNIQDAGDLVKGKIAGLTIAKTTGDPNDQSNIMLRGIISLEGSSTPLILVDGIEGDLGTVSPENIESIDVLKDASAAAIYGTRGAAGVILITTKAGRREQTTHASYSGYLSTSNFYKTLDFMNGQDVRNGLTNFTDKGYDTDWIDAISRTALTHNHNVAISGGSKSTTYSADFTYRNAQGVIIDTYSNEMKMKANVSHWMFNDILKIGFDLQKSYHKNSVNNASNGDNSNIWHQAIIRNPTSPIKNADGSWDENFSASYYYNPVAMLEELQGEYKTEETRMTGDITVEPIKGWKTKLMLSTDRSNAHTSTFYTSDYFGSSINNYAGQASHNYAYSKSDNLEVTSNYKHTWNAHRFDALLGYSYQYNMFEGFYAYNRNFATDFYGYNNLGNGAALKAGEASMSSYKNDNKLIGFFGRISYGYADRYNVLISMRREGSSKFGANHKWGSFPSASAGWTISNEKFMEDATWLDNLKLRAGYGVTGVIVGSSYESLTRYNYGSSYYYDNGEWKQGLDVASNPNPDLKWEKSAEINVGLDFSVFDGRLSGSIDWYNKRTSDMLFSYTVPTPPNLYTTTLANVGKMQNRGIEVLINAIPVQTKDFKWKTTFTLSHNSNKLLSLSNDLYQTNSYINTGYLGEPISCWTTRLAEGERVDQLYMPHVVGISENGKFLVENNATGEAEEFDGTMCNNDDYSQIVGHGLPAVTLGWGNTFYYKNFDLSLQFTSQLGFQILNENRCFYENQAVAFNKLKSVLTSEYDHVLSNLQPQTVCDYYVENGDYVKLTNFTLGYTLPLKTNKYIKSIRAYFSGDNLFTITGYSGLDPEITTNGLGYMGRDMRDKYPTIRSFTFGLNLNF